MSKRISVVGWYGQGNAGDEAFRRVFEDHLSEYELSFAQKADVTADYIILGGGGVVTGNYLKGLTAEQHILCVGVDIALNGPSWDTLVALQPKEIWCRSKEYAFIAQEQGMKQVNYCPDLGFAFNLREPALNLPPTNKPRLGVVMTNEINPLSSRKDHVANALKVLSKQWEIHFISMYEGSAQSDFEVNQEIANKAGLPDAPQHQCHDEDDAYRTIERMDMLISMRFHGVIFAVKEGVPFVSLANKGKHSIFCEQERLKQHFIELNEVTPYKLLDTVSELSKQQNLRRHLIGISNRNNQKVVQLVEAIKARHLR